MKFQRGSDIEERQKETLTLSGSALGSGANKVMAEG